MKLTPNGRLLLLSLKRGAIAVATGVGVMALLFHGPGILQTNGTRLIALAAAFAWFWIVQGAWRYVDGIPAMTRPQRQAWGAHVVTVLVVLALCAAIHLAWQVATIATVCLGVSAWLFVRVADSCRLGAVEQGGEDDTTPPFDSGELAQMSTPVTHERGLTWRSR